MSGIPKRPELLPRILDVAVLALVLLVLVCALVAVRSPHVQRRDQGSWLELRESAVKNKHKLARLLLTDSTSLATTGSSNF